MAAEPDRARGRSAGPANRTFAHWKNGVRSSESFALEHRWRQACGPGPLGRPRTERGGLRRAAGGDAQRCRRALGAECQGWPTRHAQGPLSHNGRVPDMIIGATIGEAGRVIVPAAIRDLPGLKAGDRVEFRVSDGDVVPGSAEGAHDRALGRQPRWCR